MQKYVQQIQDSSQYLLGLINDVLDMSKIESGEVKLNASPFILTEQMAQLERIIRDPAEQRGHQFTVRIRKIDHNYLVADSVRLRQILTNLLSNAVKYTPNGGCISLTVEELPSRDAERACISFTVTDNGIGMSPAFLEHVFDPFSRNENSVTNKVQGTGLGMAITKNLIDMMGGRIQIDSKLGGGGTTVTVTLELLSDTNADYKSEAKRVLLLTQDGVLRHNIENMLAPLGTAVCAADGMDGARRLLANEICDVILISGGADGFLARPFSLDEMNTAIQQAKSVTHRQTASALTGKRFLCAEDNALNAEILKAVLEMEGATCHIYPDGAELVKAFATVAPGEYDAILMDVQMPNMDGLEAARTIRGGANPLGREIPIIAMTANAFTENIQDSKAADMNAHISKPIDIELLKKTVQTLCRHR